MKIRVSDIPDEGMTLEAASAKDPWFRDLLIEVLRPECFVKGDGGRASLQLFKSGRNITVVGGVVLQFHPACDRCLAPFKKQEQVPIHQVMVPASEGAVGEKDGVDDEDVTFYKGDEIDISGVVKEAVILAQQMVNICNDKCKGLCQKCGRNLNKGACACKRGDRVGSPFAVFKGMKFKKPKKHLK